MEKLAYLAYIYVWWSHYFITSSLSHFVFPSLFKFTFWLFFIIILASNTFKRIPKFLQYVAFSFPFYTNIYWFLLNVQLLIHGWQHCDPRAKQLGPERDHLVASSLSRRLGWRDLTSRCTLRTQPSDTQRFYSLFHLQQPCL